MVSSSSSSKFERSLLCPCGKASRSEVQRISRGFFVKTFLFWLPVRRYRCYKCRKKKLVFGRSYN